MVLSAKASIWSDRPPGRFQLLARAISAVYSVPSATRLTVLVQQLVALDGRPVALVDLAEDLLAHIVDQRDAGLEQDPGPRLG